MQLSSGCKRLEHQRAFTADPEGVEDVERVISEPSAPTPAPYQKRRKVTYLNQAHHPGTPSPETCSAKNPYRIHSVTPQAPKQPRNA